MNPYLSAALAIGLWSTLAILAYYLRGIPPLLLTGLALLIGSMPSWHRVVDWRLPPTTLLLGIYGLFGYHFLLFLAFRHAPAVEVNLINYLWPLFIILFSPILFPHLILRPLHIAAGLLGFAGAGLAVSNGHGVGFDQESLAGFWAAFGAAFVWATYSLGCRRVAHFPTTAVGLFAVVSGSLALILHFALEPAYTPSNHEWLLIVLIGLGPLGGAFYAWDYAMKHGDPRRVGLLSFATPILSTLILMLAIGRPLTLTLTLAIVLVLGAGLLGWKAKH